MDDAWHDRHAGLNDDRLKVEGCDGCENAEEYAKRLAAEDEVDEPDWQYLAEAGGL